MFRDKVINKAKLDLEEVNEIIRNLFNDNISEFDFNQFCNLIVQISYLLYTKRRPTLTIGETYGILLRRFKIADESESLIKTRKKLESLNILIQPEGKFVTILPGGAQVHKETGVKLRKFKAFNLNILSGIPLDLEE